MNRNFNNWLATFRDSIADYKYYVDFEKVYYNIDSIKVELNILNTLVGSKDIKNDFKILVNKYPEILKCIPLLLAIRAHEIYCQDTNGGYLYNFNVKNISFSGNEQYDRYTYFMEHTGLFNLLENHIISNLVDYATGVETGLDSNGRKNRGGDLMEELVESFIKKSGFQENITYFKEMKIREIEEKFGINLSSISNKGKTVKCFDFVIKTKSTVYSIEVNFYASNGSKLNETARSYKYIAQESRKISNFKFVWFTDGKGWIKARKNLEETFDVMDYIYNIKDLEDGIISKVFN
ncbi:type II restriction endonuclease [Brachyspira pilosicoli]